MAEDLVPIVHEDGRTGTVPRENLAAAEQLGWHPETHEEHVEARADALPVAVAKGAVAGTVGTALALPKLATGLGSAALGVQDPLARFSGRQFLEDAAAVGAHLTGGESEVAAREAREAMQGNQIVHPYGTTAGEVGGSLLGGGLLGKAAGAVGGLAGRAGTALGLGARGAAIVAVAGASALEGAGLGANAASEQAWLKDQVATAEQTLAGIGTGALFGGATGALFGAIGTRGMKLSEQLAPRAEARGLEETAAELEAEGAADAARGGDVAGERAVLAPEEAPKAAPLEQAAEAGVGKRARSWLSDVGDEGIVDAISRGNKGALKDLGGGEAPTALRKREVGELIHEMGIPGIGKSETDMLATAEQQVSAQGSKIDKVIQAADARVAAEGSEQFAPRSIEALFPKVEALKTKLAEGAMLPQERALPEFIDETTQYLRDKAATGELLPSDIQQFRIKVDQLSKWARAEPGPKAEAARELRRTLEGFLESEVQKTAPDLLPDYTRAKKLWAAANWAQETLAERVGARNGANRLASPTDYLTGLSTLLASHNPIAAAGAAMGNKLLRERGWSTAAVIAKRLAGEAVDVSAAPVAAIPTARSIQALVAHTEQHVAEGVGRFLGGAAGGAAARVTTRRLRTSTADALRSSNISAAQTAYRDHAREVQTVATVPEVAESRLAGITGQALPAVAPGLNAAMAQVAMRGAQYLQANMPAPPTDPDSITPQLDSPPPVSATDLARYADRVEGVENPLSLVDDLKKGMVSPEKVEAVKTVWPTIFERIRANVFAQLAERKEPVPFHQRLLLDIALDGNGALEPALRPDNMAIMKRANDAALKAGQPPPASGRVPKIAGVFSTRTAQIAKG